MKHPYASFLTLELLGRPLYTGIHIVLLELGEISVSSLRRIPPCDLLETVEADCVLEYLGKCLHKRYFSNRRSGGKCRLA